MNSRSPHDVWTFCVLFHSLYWCNVGNILGMSSANGKRRYNVTSSLIGWTHTQNDPAVVMPVCACWSHRRHNVHHRHYVDVPLMKFLGMYILYIPWDMCNKTDTKMTLRRYMAWYVILHLQWRHTSLVVFQINGNSMVCLKKILLKLIWKNQQGSALQDIYYENLPVNSPHRGPIMRNAFPWHDVIMSSQSECRAWRIQNNLLA